MLAPFMAGQLNPDSLLKRVNFLVKKPLDRGTLERQGMKSDDLLQVLALRYVVRFGDFRACRPQ